MEQLASDAGDLAATSRWVLRLFGGFDIRRPDGQPVPLAGKRERILLAYLALTPERRRSRRDLIEFLWGEAADATTLDNLRTCLWSLRKALGDSEHDVLVSDREWIGINAEAFEVDVWRFVDLVAGEDPRALEPAMDLYAGDLLEGIEIESAEFAAWLRDERTRLRDIAVEALIRVMGQRAERQDTEGAIEAGQRILRIDEFHEGAVRDLMRLYAASGRRHIAIQTFRAFADRLQKDLGVGPEPETQRLLEELSKGSADPGKIGEEASAGDQPGPGDTAEAVPPAQPVPAAEASEPAPAVRTAPPRRSLALRIALWASGVLAGAVLGILVTVGIVFWRVPELAPAPLGEMILDVKRQVVAEPPSLAVLPFQGHGDPDATAFADAISEGITSALSIASDVVVISRSSVLAYTQRADTPRRIADELKVRYLLEGSVSKFGDTLDVRVGLIDIARGSQYVPIGNYEQDAGNFFALQREITIKVVTALQIQLTEGEQERFSLVEGTKSFDAWLAASEGGKQIRQMTTETNLRARHSYERAVALDPNYSGAWAGLAWTHLLEARFGWTSDRKAKIGIAARFAERAMALDDRRARNYSLMGTIALMTAEFDKARRMGERAVEMEYNDADAAALLAFTLTYTGEPQRAIALVRRAIRLRPYPPRWYEWLLARAHRLAGRPEKAVRILTSPDPTPTKSMVPLIELAAAYAEMGDLAHARAVAASILAAQPRFSVRAWLMMPSYSDPDRAQRDLQALVAAGLSE